MRRTCRSAQTAGNFRREIIILAAAVILPLMVTACREMPAPAGPKEKAETRGAAATQETSAQQEFGYRITDQKLPDDVVATVAGTSIKADLVIQRAESLMTAAHGTARDENQVKEEAVYRLLDEIILQDKLGGRMAADPRVLRGKWLEERILLANRYNAAYIQPKIIIAPRAIADRLPRSRDELLVQVLLFDPQYDEAISREFSSGASFESIRQKYALMGPGGDPNHTVRMDNSLISPEQEDYLWSLKPGQVSKSLVVQLGAIYVKVQDRRTIPEQDWKALENQMEVNIRMERAQAFILGILKKHVIIKQEAAFNAIAALQMEGRLYEDRVLGTLDGREIWFKDIDRLLPVAYVNLVSDATAQDTGAYYGLRFGDYVQLAAIGIEAEKAGVQLDEKDKEDLQLTVREITQRVLEQDVFTSVNVSQQEIADYYRNNGQEFQSADLIKASVVVAKDRTTALMVVEEFKSGVPFEQLVKNYSIDSGTKKRDGDMGWVFPKALPADLLPQIREAREGQLLPIFEYGKVFNVVLITGKKKTDTMSLEQASKRIENRLLRQKREKAYLEYIKNQRRDYPIVWDRQKFIGLKLAKRPAMAPPAGGKMHGQ